MVDQRPCKSPAWGTDHELLVALESGQEGTKPGGSPGAFERRTLLT